MFCDEIWDLREGREIYTIEGHEKPVQCARWSPSGRSFVSSGDDGMVMLWKTEFATPSIVIFFVLLFNIFVENPRLSKSNYFLHSPILLFRAVIFKNEKKQNRKMNA